MSGRWICVDGVEAVGKTTIAQALAVRLGGVRASEFSSTAVGDALRRAVQISPHYISQSAVGQSLCFIGDFFELVKSRVKPALAAGRVVVTDRGYLSKYAYQAVVLENELSRPVAENLLDSVFSHLLVPHLTLLLTSPAETLKRRLIRRGEACDEMRLRFMSDAMGAAKARLSRCPILTAEIINSDRAVDETVRDAERAVAQHLKLE